MSENTVSLNADFLKFLSDKRNSQHNSTISRGDGKKMHGSMVEETSRDGSVEERRSLLNTSVARHNNNNDSSQMRASPPILGGSHDIS